MFADLSNQKTVPAGLANSKFIIRPKRKFGQPSRFVNKGRPRATVPAVIIRPAALVR